MPVFFDGIAALYAAQDAAAPIIMSDLTALGLMLAEVLVPLLYAALLPFIYRYIPAAWLEDSGDEERLSQPVCFDECAALAVFAAALLILRISVSPPSGTPGIPLSYDLIGTGLPAGAWMPAGALPLAAVLLLGLAGFDALHLILPDQLMLALCTLSVARLFGAGFPDPTAAAAFAADLSAGLCFPLLAALGMLLCGLRGREMPFGFGDAKLLFSLCLFMGAANASMALAIGSILCGAFAGISLIFKSKTKTDRIAYGPFIVIGVFSLLV